MKGKIYKKLVALLVAVVMVSELAGLLTNPRTSHTRSHAHLTLAPASRFNPEGIERRSYGEYKMRDQGRDENPNDPRNNLQRIADIFVEKGLLSFKAERSGKEGLDKKAIIPGIHYRAGDKIKSSSLPVKVVLLGPDKVQLLAIPISKGGDAYTLTHALWQNLPDEARYTDIRVVETESEMRIELGVIGSIRADSGITEERLLLYSRVIEEYEIEGAHAGEEIHPSYWDGKIKLARERGDTEALGAFQELSGGPIASVESGSVVVNKQTGKATLLVGVSGVGKSEIARAMGSSKKTGWDYPDPEREWYLGADDFFITFFVRGKLVVGFNPKRAREHPDKDFLYAGFYPNRLPTHIRNTHRFFEAANIVVVTDRDDLPDTPSDLWGEASRNLFGILPRVDPFWDPISPDRSFEDNLLQQPISKVVLAPPKHDDHADSVERAVSRIESAHITRVCQLAPQSRMKTPELLEMAERAEGSVQGAKAPQVDAQDEAAIKGLFAAMLNHEMNQPLSVLYGSIEHTEEALKKSGKGLDDEEIKKDSRNISQAVARIREIIQRVKAISNPVDTEYALGSRMLDLEGSTILPKEETEGKRRIREILTS